MKTQTELIKGLARRNTYELVEYCNYDLHDAFEKLNKRHRSLEYSQEYYDSAIRTLLNIAMDRNWYAEGYNAGLVEGYNESAGTDERLQQSIRYAKWVAKRIQECSIEPDKVYLYADRIRAIQEEEEDFKSDTEEKYK